MGRRRLPDDEKKVDINLKITKALKDELKVKEINISKLFEEFVKDYLKK